MKQTISIKYLSFIFSFFSGQLINMSSHFDVRVASRWIDNLRDTRSLYNGIRFVSSQSALYSFKLEVVKAVTGQTTKRTTNVLVVEVTQVFSFVLALSFQRICLHLLRRPSRMSYSVHAFCTRTKYVCVAPKMCASMHLTRQLQSN